MTKTKKGIIFLYVATILGLGFSFFGSVLNSKMLTKEAFGDWKYMQNYLLFISYIVNFGFYQSGARLIAASDNVRKVKIIKGYLIFVAVVGFLIMFFISNVLGMFFSELLSPHLYTLILTIYPLFIIHPLMFYFESVYQAESRLISFSVYKALPPLLYVVSLYLFKDVISGSLLNNALVYYCTYALIFICLIFEERFIWQRSSLELTELTDENKRFGKHLYLGSLFNVGAGYLLPILIGYFSINNAEVGNYILALNFIIPLTFLPGVIGTSFYKSFITAPFIPIKALRYTAAACVVMLVCTTIGIDYFIEIFLDSRFYEVGFLVRIGATFAIMHGFGDFINKFLSAKGKGNYIKNVTVFSGIFQLILSLFLIKFFSSTGAMISKSIGSLVYLLALSIYYYRNFVLNRDCSTVEC